jgi:hypothetical protein
MSRSIFAALLLMTTLAACQGRERRESSLPELAVTAEKDTPKSESAPVATQAPATTAPVRKNGKPRATDCGAEKVGKWLNALPTAEVKADIANLVGERAIRYYTQGDAVTMDFSPTRLNVELGADGRIKLFRCG